MTETVAGPNLQKKRMVKIERNQTYCIYPTLEAALEDARSHFTEGEVDDAFTWTNIEMSQLEFEALPEFQGW